MITVLCILSFVAGFQCSRMHTQSVHDKYRRLLATVRAVYSDLVRLEIKHQTNPVGKALNDVLDKLDLVT